MSIYRHPYPDKTVLDEIGIRRLGFFVPCLDENYMGAASSLPVSESWQSDLDANVTGSLCSDGLHRPVLDLDQARSKDEAMRQAEFLFPEAAEIFVVSSTSNWHAYIPGVAFSMVEWLGDYLRSHDDDGFLEEGWISASVERGNFRLRLPGISK